MCKRVYMALNECITLTNVDVHSYAPWNIRAQTSRVKPHIRSTYDKESYHGNKATEAYFAVG